MRLVLAFVSPKIFYFSFSIFCTDFICLSSSQEEFLTQPDRAIIKAYEKTDQAILSHTPDLGQGGSTAVTAILLNGRKLWVANVGDSRAVLLKGGRPIQMSTDHDPNVERSAIENRGGFVSNMPGVSLNLQIF
jgi:protein phosphatase 1L